MLDQQQPLPSTRTARINIYVGNLSTAVTETELRRTFATFGSVVSVAIRNDAVPGTRQPRVYAYVGMSEKNDGETAIAHLDGKPLDNRVMSVISALPMSPIRKVACGHGMSGKK
jgi:RNA recognition motif-containing protein